MSLLPTVFPASLDELVFEGRNRAYGAYQLRQAYNSHMRKGLGTIIGLCALLAFGSIAWQQHQDSISCPMVSNPVIAQPITPPTYVTEAPKPAAPPAARPVAAATMHVTATQPTQIAKNEQVVPKPEAPAEITEVPPGLVATTGPATAGEVGGSATGVVGGTGTAETGSEGGTGESAAVVGPYVVVEKMPEFVGGMDALMRYLRSHLRYPNAALREQAEGRVFVSFVVQADGTIADITVPKGLGFGLDEEAQRVVRQMPAWTPGRQSNHAVPVRFTLPITFKIQ